MKVRESIYNVLNWSLNLLVLFLIGVALSSFAFATTYDYETGFYPGNLSRVNISLNNVWNENEFTNGLTTQELNFEDEYMYKAFNVGYNTTYIDPTLEECVLDPYFKCTFHNYTTFLKIQKNATITGATLNITGKEGYIHDYCLDENFITNPSFEASMGAEWTYTETDSAFSGTRVTGADFGIYRYHIHTSGGSGYGQITQNIDLTDLDYLSVYVAKEDGGGGNKAKVMIDSDVFLDGWSYDPTFVGMDVSGYTGVHTLKLQSYYAGSSPGGSGHYFDFVVNKFCGWQNPTNPYLEINNTEVWSYTGEYTSSEITPDFSNILKSYLEECTPDGSGDCEIPFMFHSDTTGTLTYSNIQVGEWANTSIYLNLPTFLKNTSLNITTTIKGFNTVLSPYFKIGNTTIWNYTGYYNETETTIDFGALALLNMSSNVFLNFYSGSTGILELFNLNITYTPNNNLTLNFFDNKANLMNESNVSIEFIGAEKFNGSTTTGIYNTGGILADTYTIVYNSPGYVQNTYILSVTLAGTYNISLYFINETASTGVEIIVQDKFGQPLDGAIVKIQKYLNNEWILEQIVETNQQGKTQGQYIVNTAFYNHIIEYNGLTVLGSINNDDDKMIIYDSDALNGIIFKVDLLGTGTADLWYNTFGVDFTLSFTNQSNTTGFFKFLWNDPTGTTQNGCIEVLSGGNQSIICTCESTESITATGDVTCAVSQPTGRVSYKAIGMLKQTDENEVLFVPVATLWADVGVDKRINWGNTGLIMGFLFVLLAFFIFIKSPAMSMYVGTSVFVLLAVLGVTFKDISYGALMVIVLIGYLIGSLKSEGGLNN